VALSLAAAARLVAAEVRVSPPPAAGPTLAVYNPDLLTDADLRAQFVARVDLLERLLAELRGPGRPQHHLLLGQRGMGKTTLLRRLRVAIEDDPALSARWTPLSFPEEQYNVARLSDLWVNCIDALGDALDRRGEAAAAAQIDALIDALPEAEGPRAEAALSILRAQAAARGGLVLLIDNLDLVLGRLKAHQWPLREVLSEAEHLVFIGASAQLIDGMADYGAAFYDFFAPHLLEGMHLAEAEQVFLRLAALRGAHHVPALLRDQPGRFKALHLLTGGNPRALVLLFQIIAQESDPSAPPRSVHLDLEALLDVCTPLYKARFEALAPQAQQVVDALALGWDPMTAAELAAAARLELNLCSAQLHRLVQEGMVERVELPDTRRIGFQVAERFFNIWYLMRASRRVRRRLSWLVRFLDVLYGAEGVRGRAQALLDDQEGAVPRRGELAMAYARVVAEPELSRALESDALDALFAEQRARIHELLDLEGEDAHLRPLVDRKVALERVRAQIRAAPVDWTAVGCTAEEMAELVLGSNSLKVGEKQRVGDGAQRLRLGQWTELLRIFQEEQESWVKHFGEHTQKALLRAIACGLMTDHSDLPGAQAAALRFACTDLVDLALIYTKDDQAAAGECMKRGALHRAVELFVRAGEYPAAEAAYRKTIELDPKNANLWNDLGNLLRDHFGRYDEAETAYRTAIELDPEDAYPWIGLGNLLQVHLGRYDEAEAAYRKAIELDPADQYSWVNLGNLLQYHLKRYDEAEAAYRKAIELAPTGAVSWTNLGNLLRGHLKRYDEAEAAYRKAIELDPKYVFPWRGLSELLIQHLDRVDDGLAAAREAARLRGDTPEAKNGLAWALYLARRDLAEAAALAADAAQAAANNPNILHTYAAVLVRAGRWGEAEVPLRQWLQLADDAHHEQHWPWVRALFIDACATGQAGAAAALLAAEGYDQRWRPLYAALRAVEAGDAARLKRFAPEVRVPATELLAVLAPHLVHPTAR
jgi:tetratricopeptide (TPR) repeat protein